MKKFQVHLRQLEKKLEILHEEPLDTLERIVQSLNSCQQTLYFMRERVVNVGFKDKESECLFFKNIKPIIVSYVIYYMNLMEIERGRPYGSNKIIKKYFLAQISFLQSYFWENKEFYQYYLHGLTDRDEEFFLRKDDSLKLHFDSIPSIIDSHFSTTHDLVLAKILGNIKTIKYLQIKLAETKYKNAHIPAQEISSLKWTGAKIDFVELVYALHSSNLVNNGQAGINELAENLENIFSIKIPDIYRSFLEIKARKSAPTKLLDILKTSLINKIVEADG